MNYVAMIAKEFKDLYQESITAPKGRKILRKLEKAYNMPYTTLHIGAEPWYQAHAIAVPPYIHVPTGRLTVGRLLHEYAHILAFHLYNYFGHGRTWYNTAKNLMNMWLKS